MGTLTHTFKPGYRFGDLTTLAERIRGFITANETLSYYLYECRLSEWKETQFLPAIGEFTLKTVTSVTQLDALAAAGFDLSLDSPLTKRGLEQGAIAFLLFVNNELASRELVATNAAAKAAIDKYPYKVDFENREACASGVWTNPKYRQKGLHTYVFFKAYDYLRQHGIKVVRSIVWVDNPAAQRAHERFSPDMRKYARGRYLRIFGLTFRWEQSLKQNEKYFAKTKTGRPEQVVVR